MKNIIFFLKKWANPGLFYCLFSIFSSKYYCNFYNNYMWKNVLPVYSARIRTHDLWNMSLIPITTGPGLPSNFDLVLSKDGLRKKRSHDNDEKIYSILKQPRFLMLLLDTVQLSETWVQQILPLFSAADKTLLHSIIPRASFCHCHKLVQNKN